MSNAGAPKSAESTESDSSLVNTVLREYGEITRQRLREYLERQRSGPADALYALAADYPERGGRALRASLCIATARSFGASLDDAINSAVALELLHNAFLIHDDVEDESAQRRGKPTLHALHGVPTAVNVGDALAVLSFRPLLDNRRSLGLRLSLSILEEAEHMARESVEGQSIELHWRANDVFDLDDDDYLTMVLKKTCWYTTIYPIRVGALIGSRGALELSRFDAFGFFLGAAFQIQDDLLNLVGNPVAYGKEINGDIREGKRTLMLIDLLRRCNSGEGQQLRRLLGSQRRARNARDVSWIRRQMEEHGSIDRAQQIASALAGAAQHECERLYRGVTDSRDRRFVEALPCWVLERA
jgi:geranylgeranyl diphosphate synthase, type II